MRIAWLPCFSCEQCPGRDAGRNWCCLESRKINGSQSIPEWCPRLSKPIPREFVEKWKKEFSGFTEGYDAEILLKKMLTELGHEVEEEK